MPEASRVVRLAARPTGLPGPGTWALGEGPVPEPSDGQVLVEVSHLSLDPAMRGWLDDVRSYVPPIGLGEVMRAHGAGRVVASRAEGWTEGDLITGMVGVREHAVLNADELVRVDESVAPVPTWLGALGLPGITAYFGLLEVGRARQGDTVVVSGAAGAVGSVVGQVARIRGCRVIGIAGGEEKCAWLTDGLGFDAAVDYKTERVGRALREHAPDGVDVYFDNVGGTILDDALARLRLGARVVICGAIAAYNATEPVPGPARYLSLLVNRASMAGFIVFDYAARYAEATAELARWIADGSLVAREQVVPAGIEGFGETLLMLFAGENTGKLVLGLDGPRAG